MRKFLQFVEKHIPRRFIDLGMRSYDRVPFALRYGAAYRDTLKMLRQSEKWSSDEHQEFQLLQLQSLVTHAYQNTRFYKELYRAYSVTPQKLKAVEDIKMFPMCSKADLRNSKDSLVAKSFPKWRLQYHTTGGSTAKPVGLYWDRKRTVPMEKAFMKRQFDWVGYDFGVEKSANFRGVPPRNNALFEYYGNTLNLNSYRASDEHLERMAREIDRFAPRVIHTYPSTALVFASFLKRSGRKLPSIELVLCGSERMLDPQRNRIEEAFDARVYTWYGQSEYVSLAGECEYSQELHFYSEYGVTEFVAENGEYATSGKSGEIVATGFLNWAFPLIRYRTEDVATLSERSTCECGREYLRASSIDGRVQEFIVSRDNNVIAMTAINMHDDTFDSVVQFQFVQSIPGEITLRVIPKHEFRNSNKEHILSSLHRKLGDQFDISIEIVDTIERTKRGKITFLVQSLKLDDFIS